MMEIGALLDNLISRILQRIFPISRMDKLQINFLITGEYFKTNFCKHTEHYSLISTPEAEKFISVQDIRFL